MESDLLLGNPPHDLQREPQPEDCEPMPDLFKPLFSLSLLMSQHADLTTRLIAIETAIDDRVCHLFGLTPADRRLLAAHSRLAMIDYPFGAV